MSSKIVSKVILTIFVMTLLIAIPCVSFASSVTSGATTSATSSVIRDNISPSLPGGQSSSAQSAARMIIGAIKWVGYACAIGMVIYIGIRYVLAAADEKASLKGMLVKVVIGSVIIVSAVGITDLVINVMSGKAGGSTSNGGSQTTSSSTNTGTSSGTNNSTNTGTSSGTNNSTGGTNGSSNNKPNGGKNWQPDYMLN